MLSSEHPIDGINSAIAELNTPEKVWLRGHVRTHRLLPSLFRFPEGERNEQRIVKRFRNHQHASGETSQGSDHALLISMHHSYFPTRLLSWTQDLHVALFCALIREVDEPTVYILDPLKLNTLSGIEGITQLDRCIPEEKSFLGWPNEQLLPELPIAISGSPYKDGRFPAQMLFTFHGRKRLPLEEQCPDCVRKVILSEREKAWAKEYMVLGS